MRGHSDCPAPPAPAEAAPTRLTGSLWQALPRSDRQRTLLTLSRVVAQQLPRPPADKEADNEPT